MNYAQVTLENGTEESVNVFDGEGREIPVSMNQAESTAFATALTALAALDPTNNGWLSPVSSITDPLEVKFVSTSIDNDVANVDKGVDTSSSATALTAIQTVINSVVARGQSSTIAVQAWLLIKDIDGTNFLAEVSFVDPNNTVTQVDLVFDSFSGPEPIPQEINLPFSPSVSGVKVARTTTLTFDDPGAAVGEAYSVILDFKDSSGSSVDSIEILDYEIQPQ